MENAQATSNNAAATEATESGERFALRITAIKGTEEAKESSILWTGRQSSNKNIPRKDMQLSQEIPTITADMVAKLDQAKVATVILDAWLAYVRRVKCQRLSIGDSVELQLPIDSDEYAQLVINMLASPAERSKKLVSLASLRALFLDSAYKAAALAVMGSKLAAWERVGQKEMLPAVCAQDAKISTARASTRDNAVLRATEIAALMPEGEHKQVLEAAAEMLAELETVDLDDSI